MSAEDGPVEQTVAARQAGARAEGGGLVESTTLDLAATVLDAFRIKGLRAATAESCTGGLVAACLTHHPGSSDVVLGGFVTYSNAMKQSVLGVPAQALEQAGAVSEIVARAMAEGACRASGADCAVSITGIAGPGGGSPDKPVGLVWFATARRGGETRSWREVLAGDRREVRARAAARALALLLARAGG